MKELQPRRDFFTTLLSIYGETFLGKWLKKAKIAKSQFQYIYIFFRIFLDFRDRSRLNAQCVVFNSEHSFGTLRSLMLQDGKKQNKNHPYSTSLKVSQELDFLEYM